MSIDVVFTPNDYDGNRPDFCKLLTSVGIKHTISMINDGTNAQISVDDVKLIKIFPFLKDPCRWCILYNCIDSLEYLLKQIDPVKIKPEWLFLAVRCINLDAVHLLVKYKVNVQAILNCTMKDIHHGYMEKNSFNILQYASRYALDNGPLGVRIYHYLESVYKFKHA